MGQALVKIVASDATNAQKCYLLLHKAMEQSLDLNNKLINARNYVGNLKYFGQGPQEYMEIAMASCSDNLDAIDYMLQATLDNAH